MQYKSLMRVGMLAGMIVVGVPAAASDLSEGEELYISQCKLCHGALTEQTSSDEPGEKVRRLHFAMLESTRETITDVADRHMTGGDFSGYGDQIAFAPPFGPSLRGIVGRAAGTYPGFDYSETMKKTLQGMIWTEAALNVWITNPQAWVPGVYMFYKQPDPEIRRKIILYLKANP